MNRIFSSLDLQTLSWSRPAEHDPKRAAVQSELEVVEKPSGQLCGKRHPFSRRRMRQGKAFCMEHHPLFDFAAVERITDDRMTDRIEMHSDLMSPSGVQDKMKDAQSWNWRRTVYSVTAERPASSEHTAIFFRLFGSRRICFSMIPRVFFTRRNQSDVDLVRRSILELGTQRPKGGRCQAMTINPLVSLSRRWTIPGECRQRLRSERRGSFLHSDGAIRWRACCPNCRRGARRDLALVDHRIASSSWMIGKSTG